MADSTSEILLKITTDVASLKELVSGMKGVGKAFEDTKNTIKTGFLLELGKKIATFALQVPAQLLQVTKAAIDMGGQLDDVSKQLNINAESFQVLSNAANEAGVEQGKFTRGLTEMTKSIGEAATNTGDTAALFEQLGLSARSLSGLELENQFTAIATAISGAEDKQKAFQATAQIFGSQTGPKMRDLLARLGKDGFGQLSDEIRATWGIMSESTVEAMDRVADTFNQLKNRLIVTVAEMLPKLQPLMDGFEKLAGWAIKIVEAFAAVGTGIGKLAGGLVYGFDAVDDADSADKRTAKADAARRAAARKSVRGDIGPEAAEIAELATAERALSNVQAARAQINAKLTENTNLQAKITASSFLTEKEKQAQILPLLQQAFELRAQSAEAARIQYEELVKIDKLQSAGFKTGADNSASAVLQRAVINPTQGQTLSPAQLAAMKEQNERFAAINAAKSEASGENAAGAGIGDSIRKSSFGGELQAQMTALKNGFVTIAQSITEVMSSAIGGISTSIEGLIKRTMTWGEAFANVGLTIGDSIVKRFAQVAAQAIANFAFMSAQWIATQFTMTAATAAGSGARQAITYSETGAVILGATAGTVAHTTGEAVKTGATLGGSVKRGVIRVAETVWHGIQVAWQTATHIAGEIAKTAASVVQSGIRIGVIIAEALASVFKAGVAALDKFPIPFVGPFLGIAAMAAIVGLGLGMVGKISKGFADGGYTGSGGKYEVAGPVHKGEVVFSQNDLARHGGVAAVERMRVQGGVTSGGAGLSARGGGVRSGPVESAPAPFNVAFHNTKMDALAALQTQEGRRVMIDFIRQNKSEI